MEVAICLYWAVIVFPHSTAPHYNAESKKTMSTQAKSASQQQNMITTLFQYTTSVKISILSHISLTTSPDS